MCFGGIVPVFNFSEDEQNIFFGIAEIRGRVSDCLVAQLKHLLDEGIVHTESIIEEIHYLENPVVKERTRTKKAKKFSGGMLKGFWHTHWFNGDASQQAINYRKLLDKEGALESILQSISKESDDPHVLAKKIADIMISQQYEDITEKKLWTGDWLIYAKYNGLNYYLMLSKHSKLGEDTDPIYLKMKDKCNDQYPFLFKS
jgi:hypothetical protein